MGFMASLVPYIKMIESFLDGTLGVEDFERRFIDMYTDDPTMWDDAVFQILDSFFADLDAFCVDPSLRDAEDLDEKQLRAAASAALRELVLITAPRR